MIKGAKLFASLKLNSVNIMSIKMDYDDVQYDTIDMFQDGSCQCPLNHTHTCPAGQVIDKSCTNNIFNKKVESWKIWLNGKGTKKRDEKAAQPFEA
ncbi:uncharacterized protein E0L32_002163 [Thyridium curvatum]|uniref:Uncharacterized protein n=1 Tax=Thyridium curvatum TaxID=1093900 RepID=A0A507ATM7_9PEZI|nr:uncharacterized protein E0L32_001970 [Thyridium curvatum]XP_030989271.1 uncharacterized protein E0L32_002163 [Thyridium curvatum]TPX07367.1 hypothetical protein E0L32_001970 [Thyridium curvatum]TPX07560.1 hypothetical protein E0L32_002163 [Thyridium curvatum]